MTPLNVLISLHRGYGLGDATQMSAVLRHVAKHRPNWFADYQAEAGKFCVGRGIINGTCYEYGKNPDPDKVYDAEVEIRLYDTFHRFSDRPNTRVSSALRECFGMDWDADCGRYQVYVRPEVTQAAKMLVYSDDVVAIHYQGDTAQARKNLSHDQADRVCRAVDELDYQPLVLDWFDRSPLGFRRISGPTEWGGDAERVCAVVSQCRAFVGIDSGPSKCASATGTPTLVVWSGHHPALFHDPAPNTIHLVPRGYHKLEPVCDDPGTVAFFESHYNVRQYDGDPVDEVKDWLREVLR